MGKCEDLVCRL
uniref:Uncharacterized protein n=1 Tax=Rhizophora mucronata TaxID=61149 RepID=A0A2P2JAW2_RHIMU